MLRLARRHCALVLLAALTTSGCAVRLRADSLGSLVDEGVERGLPGVVLLVDRPGDEHDFLDALGYADLAGAEGLTTDARFRVASNGKSFVAMALATLVLEGRVELDQPAAKWLPAEAIAGIANAERVTIRQLLDHTSGIVDYGDADYYAVVEANPTHVWSIADGLALAANEPAEFAPGEGWSYSNTNYLLAGLVIEGATGRPWGELVHERVIGPLGLDATFVEGSGAPTGPIVHGYALYRRGLTDMFAINGAYGLPDAGVVSTASDLGEWIRAIATRAAPLTDAARLVTDPLIETGNEDRYGLGVSHYADYDGYGVEAWGHGGAIDGYLSDMFYFPASETTLVLLVNGSDGKFDDLYDAVLDRAVYLALQEHLLR